jgi:LDH2 family malate/lactate/ureidoglycolate dehydrogenase
MSKRDEVLAKMAALGFDDEASAVLTDHFLDAEARGRHGHGMTRVAWLSTLSDLNPRALGYLTLAAICRAQLEQSPEHARVIVARNCFPTGMLGHWVRKLAEGGLVAALTATSPARLPHPDGGDPLAGTNPLAIAIPSTDGQPIVSDVSMGKVTYGDVLAGEATKDDLVPFGGEQAHKAFALALGLQLLVDALAGDGYGAVMVVARPEADPVPALRARASGVRLPGDR